MIGVGERLEVQSGRLHCCFTSTIRKRVGVWNFFESTEKVEKQ